MFKTSLGAGRVSVSQIKAARALLEWKQSDLSRASGVSMPTLSRLEMGTGDIAGRASTVTKLIAALEGAGVVFLPIGGEDLGGPGVRLRQAKG
jgi:transcriptional regulator with XRE-family HTH domain